MISEILQFTGIECISDSKCRQVWGGTNTIGPRQQCADKNGVSSCMGDSGGPLTRVNKNGETVLLGNVSWGHGRCDLRGYPAIYSRNAEPSVNQWIVRNARL